MGETACRRLMLEIEMSTYRLQNLLLPSSIALVAGSPRPNSVGRAVLDNIVKARFEGKLGLINSRYPEISSIAAVGSLAELPFLPELVVITTPPPSIPDLIDRAGALGPAGALIITSGLGHGAT